MSLAPGRQIGRYEIRSPLGAGGMGEVYLAEDTKLHRPVALKILPAEFEQDKQRSARFLREAQAASALNHPNICTVYEINDETDVPFIAMEYVEGQTLLEKIKSHSFDLTEALDIALQLADALAEAHAHGIIHRDIKPANIIINRRGRVKILDFGLAKRITVESDAETQKLLSHAGMILGTVAYMSPEQARGLSVDARTDVWSFGVVLYEMLTGAKPFDGATTSDLLAAILRSEPEDLRKFKRDVPSELERIILKSLSKERAERYTSAEDLFGELKQLKKYLESAATDASTSAIDRGREAESKISQAETPDSISFKSSTSGGARVAKATPEPSEAQTAIISLSINDRPNTADIKAQTAGERTPQDGLKTRRRLIIGSLSSLLLIVALGLGYWFYVKRSAASSSKSESIESIAVMPFVNASGNPDVEYLSDGITESLINNLSRLQSLRVIARSTVFSFKGRDLQPQQIGKQLNVRAILNGRVIQRGDTLHIQVDLVDADNGTEIWGQNYQPKQADVLQVQEAIARDITERLRLKLTGEEQKLLTKRYTNNAEAYEYYLKGRYHYYNLTEAEWHQALDDFNQAVIKDPNYALAYTGIADCYGLASAWLMPPAEAYPKLQEASLKALQIDNTLAEAWAALASYKLFYEHDWVSAEHELKHALELNPDSTSARLYYSFYLYASGRTDECLDVLRHALQSDPLSLPLNTNLAETFYYARRYDEALDVAGKMFEIDHDAIFAHLFAGWAYQQKRQYEAAVAEFQQARQLEKTWATAALGNVYAVSGRKDEALRMLADLQAAARKRYISPYFFALIYTGLGDKDQAFAWLNKAYDEHNDYLIYLKVEPLFDPLRADPRFQDLLRRVGLTP